VSTKPCDHKAFQPTDNHSARVERASKKQGDGCARGFQVECLQFQFYSYSEFHFFISNLFHTHVIYMFCYSTLSLSLS
jgi:hypothetical protein